MNFGDGKPVCVDMLYAVAGCLSDEKVAFAGLSVDAIVTEKLIYLSVSRGDRREVFSVWVDGSTLVLEYEASLYDRFDQHSFDLSSNQYSFDLSDPGVFAAALKVAVCYVL